MRLTRGTVTQAMAVLALVVASATACEPADDNGATRSARALISDQVHDDGTAGFFFLPPLVPRPGNFGEQVPGLWPTVNIDQIDATGEVLQPVATFTRTSGPSDERLRRHLANGPAVDDDGDTDPDGYFVARWKTAALDAPAGTFFRLRVLAAGRELGFADVEVVGSKKDLKNVDRNELVGLLEDRTLRIKFRIERSAVDRDGDGSFDWADNCPAVANADQADSVGNGVGDACRCPTGADACPPSTRLYALMTTTFDGTASPTSLEIVDLDSKLHVHSIDLGSRAAFSLAVTADGARAYVSDAANGEVAVYDTVSGAELAAIPVAGAFDLALAHDGATLFAGGANLVAVDTATNTIRAEYAFSDASPLGLAVSPDGTRVGVVTTFGGSNPRYDLFDVSHGVELLAAVPIAGDVEGCDAFPNDTVFANDGRALVWDSNCDSLYQVDLATTSQLASSTVDTGRDVGSSFNANNALVYLPTSGLALIMKESNQVVSVDPAARSFSTTASFIDTPFVVAAAPDGRTAYVSVIHQFTDAGGDSLDAIDSSASTVARSVYLFSDASKIVRDMRIVRP